MGRLSFLRFSAQRVLDISIVSLAVGCGSVGYYLNANEDEAARRKRLHEEHARRQRRRVEEVKRRSFEHLKSLSKQHQEKVELLLQKRKEIVALHDEMEALNVRLQEQHKELELEIKEIRRLVKLKEELRMRSQTLNGSVLKNENAARASEGEAEKKIGDPGDITSTK